MLSASAANTTPARSSFEADALLILRRDKVTAREAPLIACLSFTLAYATRRKYHDAPRAYPQLFVLTP